MLLDRLKYCVDDRPEVTRILGHLLEALDPDPNVRSVQFLNYMDLLLFRYPLPGRGVVRVWQEAPSGKGFKKILDAIQDKGISETQFMSVAEDITGSVHFPEWVTRGTKNDF